MHELLIATVGFAFGTWVTTLVAVLVSNPKRQRIDDTAGSAP